MITLPTIALSPNASEVVQIPISQLGGPVGSVKVANESPWPLQISIAGNEQTLPAWMADVYPAAGIQTFTIAAVPLASATSAYATAAAMVTVAMQGETIPGTYPVALVRAQQTLPSMCKVAEPITSGDLTFHVDNPGALTPGGFVWMQPALATGGTGQGVAYPIGYVGMDGTVQLAAYGFERNFAVGDLVVNVPFYVIASNVQPIQIAVQPPLYWQVPSKQYTFFGSAPLGATAVVTPPAGQQVYLYNTYSVNQGGEGYFYANGMQITPNPVSTDEIVTYDCKGLALGTGNPLEIVGSNTASVSMGALYSLGV